HDISPLPLHDALPISSFRFRSCFSSGPLAGSTERPAAFTGRALTRKGGRRLRPPFAPMEALSADEIPTGSGGQYEPKWDGFRCLLFRNGRNVVLQSKSGRSL